VDDVFMTTGAGHSLQMAIQALASPKQNILVPNPGWNYYRVLCQAYQVIIVTF
jgi:aspartate/methionine/tyrosine aminotransferase